MMQTVQAKRQIMNELRPVILFEDRDILVADKPSGMPVIPDRHGERLSLREWLERERNEKMWVVHRIDAGTSGLVLFARNAEGHSYFNNQFADRLVAKRYLALVKGCPPEDEGDIYAPLQKRNSRRDPVRVHADGKAAHSHYRVVEKFNGFCLVEIMPHTGRTHQIRVHMAHVGCPLAIDALYGMDEAITTSTIANSFKKGARLLIDRLTLHAWKLETEMPDGTRQSFEAPLPDDLSALLEALRKNAK